MTLSFYCFHAPTPTPATHWLWAPGDHWYALADTTLEDWVGTKRTVPQRWMIRPIGNVPTSGTMHWRNAENAEHSAKLSYSPVHHHRALLEEILPDKDLAAAVLKEFVLVPRTMLPHAAIVDDVGTVQAGSQVYPSTMDTDLLRMSAGATLAIADFIDALSEESTP
ncbi:hypothetical protein IV500_05025 [Paeniglutamicibacter antarcticus]|uniref:Uncharacterized protein n=1 Tax=Arthrobacter terrae TaxID=2935737 RepID=A0A931CPT3_9MICC|nr:hypothetical protein [Arthrobacter terrae]MBG0738781.1 hypothetical protein [Arthrobacter terrae]